MLFIYSSLGHGTHPLRYVLACSTACEQVHLYACVCKSSRVSFIALGGRYWSDLRLRWDKALERDKVGGEEEGRGCALAVETIPRPAIRGRQSYGLRV